MTEENNRRSQRPVYRKETSPIQAGKNLSWASIFAGTVTALALFTVLSLLTAALGFGLFAPTKANPMAGIGIGTGILTIVILLLSFCAGGFIAGYAARSTGMLHGAISWALTVLLLVTLTFNTLALALGFTSNVLGKVLGKAGSATFNVTSSVADITGDGLSEGLEKAGGAISDVDTKELKDNLEKYLNYTDVKELKADYLEGQLQESRDEITKAVKDIAINPENKDAIIKDLTESLKEKAKKISNSADKDAIDRALALNSSLTEQEASEVSENIYKGLQDASKKAEESIDKANAEIQKFSSKASEKVDDAKQGAESASKKASLGSILIFLGLIFALVVSAFAGKYGENKSKEILR